MLINNARNLIKIVLNLITIQILVHYPVHAVTNELYMITCTIILSKHNATIFQAQLHKIEILLVYSACTQRESIDSVHPY